MSDLTLGVESVEGGYRWRISQHGEPFAFGWPLATDMEVAFQAGVVMLEQLRPRPVVRSPQKEAALREHVRNMLPPQQYGSAPLSAVLPAGVTVLEPPKPAVRSEWHKAMGTMPNGSTAPRVRSRYLVNRIARVANIRGWRCCYCGIPLTGATATIEHIVAQADGGGNDLANLELNCQTCNNERSRLPPDLYIEWRRRRGLPIWDGAYSAFWMPYAQPVKKPPSIW